MTWLIQTNENTLSRHVVMNFDKHLPSEGVMSSGFHGIFRQKTVMYTGDFDENIVTIMESLSLNNNILSFVKYYRFIIHLFNIQRSEQADLSNWGLSVTSVLSPILLTQYRLDWQIREKFLGWTEYRIDYEVWSCI